MKNEKYKILITGGHSTPAFAVLDELRAMSDEQGANDLANVSSSKLQTVAHSPKPQALSFIWVGEKYNQRGNKNVSAEYNIVTKRYGIGFVNLRSGKLIRAWSLGSLIHAVSELALLIWGFIHSFFIILKYQPDLILSFGGFTAVPIVINAKLFRKKVVTHEQTIVTGLANKIIGRFADRILVSWEQSLNYFPVSKTRLVGNPIRDDIFQVKSDNLKDLDDNLLTIYVTGGNQGAHEINKRIFPIVKKLVQNFNVVHQTGNSTLTNDYATALKLREELPDNLQERYFVKEYFGPEEIGEVLQRSSILVSRAGANTITEILSLGKLAILIPIPWASQDEQTKNARMLEEVGLGIVLKQDSGLTPEILWDKIKLSIDSINNDNDLNGNDLLDTVRKARSYVKLDAAEKVASEVLSLL